MVYNSSICFELLEIYNFILRSFYLLSLVLIAYNGPPACALPGICFYLIKDMLFCWICARAKKTGGIAYAGCYEIVGPPVHCGPGIGAEFDLLPYFFLDEKVSKKSSRNEASTRPARIGRSLGSSPRSLMRAFPPSPARRFDRPPRPKNKRSSFLL